MKPLYTQEQFDAVDSTYKLPCECYVCHSTFFVMKKSIKQELKHNRGRIKYCNKLCHDKKQVIDNPKQIVSCLNCNVKFEKLLNQIKLSPNYFCSQSCAGTYHNTHKTHGTRRSKLEVWLEEQLINQYPYLEIHFNRKDAINSELDIYIPSLKLAFELNGIFHYEPIFGKDKLNKIQNNDNRKFQACIENEISLCVINSSMLKYFKSEKAKEYLDIIDGIIKTKIPS